MLPARSSRFLLVKHSEGWNVDRCCRWMESRGQAFDWFYPASGQAFPDPEHYDGVIVFGGANSANDCSECKWVSDELHFIEQCIQYDKAFFGICLGAQMLARVLGAQVRKHPEELQEIGFHQVNPTAEGADFMAEPLTVMQWHSEGFDLPSGTTLMARSADFPNQAFQLNKRVVGVQFHPEVNPDVLRVWHEHNRIRRPGQLNDEIRQNQLEDAMHHDAAISRWLDSFLTRWAGLDASGMLIQ